MLRTKLVFRTLQRHVSCEVKALPSLVVNVAPTRVCPLVAGLEHRPHSFCTSSSAALSSLDDEPKDPVLEDALDRIEAPPSNLDTSTTKPFSVLDQLDLMEQPTCQGCGIPLQFTNVSTLGYCPPHIVEGLTTVAELNQCLCQRCYRIRYNGQLPATSLPAQDYERVLREVRGLDTLMVQIVDALDLEGSMLSKSRHLFGKKPVILVVNKIDLLPEFSGQRRLIRYVQDLARKAGIERVIDIHLVSSASGLGIHQLLKTMKKNRQRRDICVVGSANAGKSSFLNALTKFLQEKSRRRNWASQRPSLPDHKPTLALSTSSSLDDTSELLVIDESTSAEAMKDDTPEENPELDVVYGSEAELDAILELQKNQEILESRDDGALQEPETHASSVGTVTESAFPGTTLAVQSIPLPEWWSTEMGRILDTPGLITCSRRQGLIETLARAGSTELGQILPTSRLTPRTFRLTPGRSVFLGGLARVDYTRMSQDERRDCRLLLTWYGALPGHLTKTENASALYIKHAGGLLSPPRGLDCLSQIGRLEPKLEVLARDYLTQAVEKKSKYLKKPKRTSILELVLPSFGWLSISAVDLDGTVRAMDTLKKAKISIHAVEGIDPVARSAIFPYELSRSTRASWQT